jgi:hypothetical protein
MRQARAVMADRERAARLRAAAEGNGGGADGRVFADAALRFTHGLAQLDWWGVIVRDLDTGICDFPALREGREVYLCWRVGEERIGWWHEIDGGFAGRQPLDDAIH